MKQSLLTLAAMAFAAATTAAPCNFTMNAAKRTMTLNGNCDVTTPAEHVVVPDGYTLRGNGYTITASGSLFKGAVVSNGGAWAGVEDLTVTAMGLPCACHGGADRVRGILLENGGGRIKNVTVSAMNQGSCGCQEGNGVEVRNAPFDGSGVDPYKITVENVDVLQYQKNGVTCNGNSECTIKKVVADGLGNVPFIAQNGIQFGYGAKGRVQQSLIDGHYYTGANWSSAGILVFEASNVKVFNNDIRNNQVGVTIESWHYQCPLASNNEIKGNDIEESEWGVIVDALTYAGYSAGDAHADANKVVGNRIINVNMTGDTGIYVGVGDYGGGFNPTADSNMINGNRISGFNTPVTHDGDTNSRGNQLQAATAPSVQPFEP